MYRSFLSLLYMKGQIKGRINKQTSMQNDSNLLKISQYERADKRSDKQTNKCLQCAHNVSDNL